MIYALSRDSDTAAERSTGRVAGDGGTGSYWGACYNQHLAHGCRRGARRRACRAGGPVDPGEPMKAASGTVRGFSWVVAIAALVAVVVMLTHRPPKHPTVPLIAAAHELPAPDASSATRAGGNSADDITDSAMPAA